MTELDFSGLGKALTGEEPTAEELGAVIPPAPKDSKV